jgi:NADH-quinone oxidoreductase subunit F
MAEQRGTVGGRVLTEWFANPDLHTLDTYESLGGYSALRKVLTTMTPQQVIDEVKISGLRGRGGADFPTATKWAFVPKDHPGPKYIVVNADESEPGSGKDRYLMENSPHALVEGAAIATFAIGGHQAWVYIRGEYDLPYEMLRAAIDEAHAKGYLGSRPFGSDYPLEIRLYRGHGAYICGEETALLESLEGKRAQPRSRPPFPALKGAWGMPTAVNNVETLSTVPWILRHGGAEYAKVGTEKAKGTRMVTLSGDVQRPGNYEIEIGITYRDVIEGLGGGALPGRELKVFWPGGSSARVLPASMIDTTTDLDYLKSIGSMAGSGGIIVMDDSHCVVKAAHRLLKFYAHESCGKCTPCRVGGNWAVRTYERILANEGSQIELGILERVSDGLQNGRCLCGLGDAAGWVIDSTFRHFRNEYEDHALRHTCNVGKVAAHA